MIDSAQEAVAAFHKWNDAWNARDTETQISQMHFPHLRLVRNNVFNKWETSDDFRATEEATTARLSAEGWHHTTTLSVDAVQVGPEKVHLVIRQSRQHADGT